tara:strand:+ start:78 stop:893 length:816 start_codon:yes stop_codon:yes gene_type:complete
MSNLKIFCITINDDHFDKLKQLNYLPVGLGKGIKNDRFFRDNNGENIANKNSFYGEYTFHYWLWKNKIIEKEKNWIGFCQYRKHWISKRNSQELNTVSELNKILLKKIDNSNDEFESILGNEIYVNQFRFSKFVKKNLTTMLSKPSLIFNKNKRTIKFHFDMMHGKGNLDRAIDYLDKNEQGDFKEFVNSEVSFNPHNMFICKSYKILDKYYSSLFPWLERCEKLFGFDLDGYGLKRIYGFLAERYMSYWFKKYTKFTTMPILFKDVSDLN